MRDSVTLLTLTANLHAASREPQHWPAAWAELCQWLDCPGVLGPVDALATDITAFTAAIRERAIDMRRCAETASGLCGQTDEQKRKVCLALVEHLDHALANTWRAAPDGLADACLAALDTLPVPMILCRTDHQLVHANRAGMAELLRQRWLRLENDRVFACGDRLHAQFSAAFSTLAATPATIGSRLLSTPPVDGNAADITLRRLTNTESNVLVTLVTHTPEHTEERLASMGERRHLPPRQRELAGLLLTGESLNSAAEKMGITRRTARDHLEGLFRATGTRRQQDLITRLRSDTNG